MSSDLPQARFFEQRSEFQAALLEAMQEHRVTVQGKNVTIRGAILGGFKAGIDRHGVDDRAPGAGGLGLGKQFFERNRFSLQLGVLGGAGLGDAVELWLDGGADQVSNR